MKKHLVLSYLLAILLAAAVSIQGQEEVTDSEGEPLLVDVFYIIKPVKTDNKDRGGLVPLPRSCPYSIAQTPYPGIRGLPTRFAPANSVKYDVVKTSTDVSIEIHSDYWPFCEEFSTFWEFDEKSYASGAPRRILVGGVRGSRNSSFRIEKAGKEPNTYKLTTYLGTIGTITAPSGQRELIITNEESKTVVVKFDFTYVRATSKVEKSGLRMFPSE